MYYYGQDGAVFCALEDDLALPRCPAPAEKVPLTFLFSAPPEGRRCSFAVTDPRQLTAEEGVAWLDSRRLPDAPTLDAPVARAIENGELRAVNYRHPFWRRAPLRQSLCTGFPWSHPTAFVSPVRSVPPRRYRRCLRETLCSRRLRQC